MRLPEVSRPQNRLEVDQILTKAGYRRIGKGVFGAVYEKPGRSYVLKVFTARDKAYLDFITLARAHRDNPHFPRFFGTLVRVKDYYAIRMEKLTIFDPHRLGNYAYAVCDYIQDGVDDGELKAFPELKRACDLVRTKLLWQYWYDNKPESFMMRGDTIVIADAALDPVGSEDMRWSPEPSLDQPEPSLARLAAPKFDDDDELLRQLTEPD